MNIKLINLFYIKSDKFITLKFYNLRISFLLYYFYDNSPSRDKSYGGYVGTAKLHCFIMFVQLSMRLSCVHHVLTLKN